MEGDICICAGWEIIKDELLRICLYYKGAVMDKRNSKHFYSCSFENTVDRFIITQTSAIIHI